MSYVDKFTYSNIRLNLYFVSSNKTKSTHICHLCDLFGIPVRFYKDLFKTYEEDYSLDPNELLRRSVRYVTKKLQHLGLFFIEDTTMKIEALSSNNKEYPGLATKEFFKQNSFNDIDTLIKSKGNDRRASIISRLSLHIPGLDEPEVFTGCINGEIVEKLPVISKEKQPVWLSERSPINYFIPNGESRVLSNLAVEDSYQYDVRLQALRKLLHRLSQFISIIENSSFIYKRKSKSIYGQLSLFTPPLIVITGYTCAGKTTSSLYLSKKYDFNYIEASSLIEKIADRMVKNSIDLVPFINKMLKENGPYFFINNLTKMHHNALENQLIISGVRGIKEIKFLKEKYSYAFVIFIDSSFQLRYLRNKIRHDKTPLSYSEFKDLATIEEQWGMEEIKKEANIVVRNIGNIQNLIVELDNAIMK